MFSIQQLFQDKIDGVQRQLDEMKKNQTQFEETVRRNRKMMVRNVPVYSSFTLQALKLHLYLQEAMGNLTGVD